MANYVLVSGDELDVAFQRWYSIGRSFTMYPRTAFARFLDNSALPVNLGQFSTRGNWLMSPDASHRIKMLNSDHWLTWLKAYQANYGLDCYKTH